MRLLAERFELGELALDLGLDVEWLAPHPDAPGVRSLDQLPDLGDELCVAQERAGRALVGEDPLELRVDIERLLAAGGKAVGLRLQELADLGLADLTRDR